MYEEKILLTQKDILEQDFKIDARGYRPQEVDKFLDMVMCDYSEFNTIINRLKNDLNEAISDKKLLIANKITDNLQERTIDMRFLLKNQEYDRNKRYYLTIENSETGVVLEQIQFVIDIVKFKMF